ncbi:DNA-J related domain-containing protein [Rheinheimera metallidurans]|uniref:DNA-J related domain-containing protein n=1 Tax=Rheinheimera metallidurans TaxID=2925781 RepID=UPI0030031B86
MTISNAPLAESILTLLQGQLHSLILAHQPENSVIEEQYLLQRLGLKLQADEVISADLARFQQHFVLYHLLYRLQHSLILEQQIYLNIGLAKVQCLAISDAPEQQADASRRAYYLNWHNFYAMTEQILDQQLQAFWQNVNRQSSTTYIPTAEALNLLELDLSFNLLQLKKAYRVKALQLHPDRGGDQQQFILLRQAYQQLLQKF